MRKCFVAVICVSVGSPTLAQAQVLTYDQQSYIQKAAQWAEHIVQLKEEVTQMTNVFSSVSGISRYGDLLSDSVGLSKAVLPNEWSSVYADAATSGSQYLSTASTLQSTFSQKLSSQSAFDALSMTTQQLSQKGFMDRVMGDTLYDDNQRQLNNISTLGGQISGTTTLKESSDLHSRIAAQAVEIAAQDQKIKVMSMQQVAQDKIIAEQQRQAAQKYSLGDTDSSSSYSYDFSE